MAVKLVPEGRFNRKVKDVIGGEAVEILIIGWKPGTDLLASVKKCDGKIPENPIGRNVTIEFDPKSDPAQLRIAKLSFPA